MLNLNKVGRPLARIDGGKYSGRVVSVSDQFLNSKQQQEPDDSLIQEFRQLKIANDSKFQHIPDTTKEREILYITGPSGSGKSTYTRKYLEQYNEFRGAALRDRGGLQALRRELQGPRPPEAHPGRGAGDRHRRAPGLSYRSRRIRTAPRKTTAAIALTPLGKKRRPACTSGLGRLSRLKPRGRSSGGGPRKIDSAVMVGPSAMMTALSNDSSSSWMLAMAAASDLSVGGRSSSRRRGRRAKPSSRIRTASALMLIVCPASANSCWMSSIERFLLRMATAICRTRSRTGARAKLF